MYEGKTYHAGLNQPDFKILPGSVSLDGVVWSVCSQALGKPSASTAVLLGQETRKSQSQGGSGLRFVRATGELFEEVWKMLNDVGCFRMTRNDRVLRKKV